MPLFDYKGREKRGNVVEGRLEASSAEEVVNHLLTHSITPLDITPTQLTSGSMGSWSDFLGFNRVNIEELMLFSRQMATLLEAGVSVAVSMEQIAVTTNSKPFKKALYKIVETVTRGQSLSLSMKQHPKVFSLIFVSVVDVGENSGNLSEVFGQLSHYLETEVNNVRRIKSATRYPTFVVFAICIAITIINLFVVPAFSKLYASFKAELPWPTRAIIALSNFFVHEWPLLLIMLISIIFGIKFLLSMENFRLFWDKQKLRIPIIGSIFNRIILTRFSWAFALVLRAGVPLSTSISTIVPALGNKYMERRLLAMRENIEKGESITHATTKSGLFSSLVLQMLSVGEESGKLDNMLSEVANYYERELDYDLRRLGDLIEPVLLAVVGGMVLILALGVFLPMWDLVKFAR